MRIKDTKILNNGALIPVIGLGTWKSASNTSFAVNHALSCGYRHIDCAAIYRNEKEVGGALKKIKREDIFVTSKLWNTEHRRDAVKRACKASLGDLGLDYLDLYLMHWGLAIAPNKGSGGRLIEYRLDENGVLEIEKISVRETWEAMEELVDAGLVKAIGVANFTVPMLIDLLSYARIKPAVNQVELHPYLQQPELLEFCKYNNIVVAAYSPLGSPGNYKKKGFPLLIEDETIMEIAKAHNKSSSQVLLRWGLQRDTIVIPKSVDYDRIQENVNVFDFELSEEEMKMIEKLNKNLRFVDPLVWWKIPYFS